MKNNFQRTLTTQRTLRQGLRLLIQKELVLFGVVLDDVRGQVPRRAERFRAQVAVPPLVQESLARQHAVLASAGLAVRRQPHLRGHQVVDVVLEVIGAPITAFPEEWRLETFLFLLASLPIKEFLILLRNFLISHSLHLEMSQKNAERNRKREKTRI
jgi:hypothetical protein